jgi:hypothetical protein
MKRSKFIGILVAFGLFIFSVSVTDGLEIKRTEYFNPKGYNVPDVGSARLKSEEMIDLTDKIEGKETLMCTYEAQDGSLFRVYSIKGKVFRYDLDIDKKFPYEYALLDKDGDGIFETRQELTGEMVLEGKKERFYIDIDKATPYEYIHVIERAEGSYEWRQRLRGETVFIPIWVIFRF